MLFTKVLVVSLRIYPFPFKGGNRAISPHIFLRPHVISLFSLFPPSFFETVLFPPQPKLFSPESLKIPFFSGAPAAREKKLFALALPLVFASLLASRLDHPVTRFGHPMTRLGHL